MSGATCVEDEDCKPGCRCPADMVENDDGECVQRNQCYCTDSSGNVYPPLATFDDKENCRKGECTANGLQYTSYDCKIDCQFSNWTDWGVCDAECGGGVQSRYRSTDNPAAANGGAECVGPTKEDRPCNEFTCAVTTTPSSETTATGPPKTCELVAVTQDLSIGNCVAKSVTLDKCTGSCPSMQETSASNGMFTFVSSCYCCQGNMTTTSVPFECESGRVRYIDVPHHSSCACNLCSQYSSDDAM